MFRATRTTSIGTLAGAGLLAVALLSGCGDGGAASGPTTGAGAPTGSPAAGGAQGAVPVTTPPPVAPSQAGPHNETDVAFAKSMIPHNVQALASTQIAASKATQSQVKVVASKISSAQVPEIETFSAWLTGWGQVVPAGSIAQGQEAGISQAELVQLSKATTGFDKLWLNTMIKHQQLAVTMAQAEVKSGSNAPAKALAQKIITDQGAAITTMQTLLKSA